MQKTEIAKLFGVPFTDGELLAPALALGLLAMLSIMWLLSLYLAPGRLMIDPAAGLVRRELRPYVRRRVIEAPAGSWRASVLYFSKADQDNHTFKRLELVGPGHQEVLLFSDVRRGEALIAALEAMAGALGDYTIVVQRR